MAEQDENTIRHYRNRQTESGTLEALMQAFEQWQRWFDSQLDLDPERLVFIDETATATNMTRSHDR